MGPIARRLTTALVLAVLLAGGAAVAVAERADTPPVSGPATFDGRFVFVRIRYADGYAGGGFYGRQDLPWSHDYPNAEHNLMRIMSDISLLDVYMGRDGGSILMLDDPNLFKYPFAYMSEPGYWTLSKAEEEGLRNYLLKGGFLIFDDFHADDHWFNLETQMKKVLPDLNWIQLEATHPVYHSFFDVDSLDDFPRQYEETPIFFGLFEHNDPNGRLIAVANHNNDIGEYWEFDGTGWFAIDSTNAAYKLGVNYIMYAMTH